MPRACRILATVVPFFLAGSGCVSVHTPSTSVQVGFTDLHIPGVHHEDPDATPYAKSLRKVSEQQSRVARQLGEDDWEDVVKRSGEWVTQVRELAGYAPTSHDPALFRSCCQQLQEQIELLEQAALRRDAGRAEEAFAACNPPLDALVQNFPLTRQAMAASPAPVRPAPPAPAPRPAPAVP